MKTFSKLILSVLLLSSSLNVKASPLDWPGQAAQTTSEFCSEHKLALGITAGTYCVVTVGGLLALRKIVGNLGYLGLPMAKRPEHMWPDSICTKSLPKEIKNRNESNITKFQIVIDEYRTDGTERASKIEASTFEELKTEIKNYLSSLSNIQLDSLTVRPTLHIEKLNNFLLQKLLGKIIPFKPLECKFNTFRLFTKTKTQLLEQLEEQIIKCFMKKGETQLFTRDGKMVLVTVK